MSATDKTNQNPAIPVLPIAYPDQSIGSRQMNRMRQALRNIAGGVQPPTQVDPIAGTTGTEAQQLRITETSGADHVVAETWDGETAGSIIYVAKPYLLRQTPFDGETRNSISYVYTDANTRTASKAGESDITEVITTSYQIGDIIYAMSPIAGGLAVTITIDGLPVNPTWLDINVDGRVWSEL